MQIKENMTALLKVSHGMYIGVLVILAVMLFDIIGENLKRLWNPDSGNE